MIFGPLKSIGPASHCAAKGYYSDMTARMLLLTGECNIKLAQ